MYASVISNELKYSSMINSDNSDNKTYKLLKNSTKREMIEAHKIFLAQYKLELHKNMEILPSIYLLTKDA